MLKCELIVCLCMGCVLWEFCVWIKCVGCSFVIDDVWILNCFVDVVDWVVFGYWEGDLIIGLEKFVIGILVEWYSWYMMLLYLFWMDVFGIILYVKNGLVLVGYGVEVVCDVIIV